jgi:ribosomal protein S27E
MALLVFSSSVTASFVRVRFCTAVAANPVGGTARAAQTARAGIASVVRITDDF